MSNRPSMVKEKLAYNTLTARICKTLKRICLFSN